jgi:hypothetical protein
LLPLARKPDGLILVRLCDSSARADHHTALVYVPKRDVPGQREREHRRHERVLRGDGGDVDVHFLPVACSAVVEAAVLFSFMVRRFTEPQICFTTL